MQSYLYQFRGKSNKICGLVESLDNGHALVCLHPKVYECKLQFIRRKNKGAQANF